MSSSERASWRRENTASLLRQLPRLWQQRRRSEGWADAVRGIVASLRAFGHQQPLQRLFAQEVFQRHVAGSNPLFAVSHQHFLSTALTIRQRLDCAAAHFEFEGRHADAAYQAAVYGGAGLELWHEEHDGVHYTIRLRSAGGLLHEGPARVTLEAGSTVLHTSSFAWIPLQQLAATAPRRWLMFIARNQSGRQDSPAMLAFREAFKHNAPSYFCMAALLGVAEAHGLHEVAGIDHPYQLAYEPAREAGFRRSYAEFWASFGGAPALAQAHLIPVPAQPAPLSQVAAKHRTRARVRRQHWAGITASSIAALRPHLQPLQLPARVLSTPSLAERARNATQWLPGWASSLLTLVPVGVL